MTLLYDWSFWARPAQLPPPGDWHTWLINAGRGFGKTRAGAEWVRDQVERRGKRRIAIVGRTVADVRDVMINGPSGLLAISPPASRPAYNPSLRRLTWPNGAIGLTFSADQPDQLRGPQHDAAWGDELAAWRYSDAFDQLMFGLRMGDSPRAVFTTTPRPTPLIKRLLADSRTVVTTGSTYDNSANLSAIFLAMINSRYGGTRLGRQEIEAVVLDDNPSALWKRGQIEATRIRHTPPLERIVVAIDPSASSGDDAAEAGIVTAARGNDGRAYVLDDASMRGTPHQWASVAIAQYHKFKADRIIGETNNGGEMVGTILRTIEPNIPFSAVSASRGKLTRAEPVSALYEQGRVSHVGAFAEMEDQMCEWVPGQPSPDRMDALVWALTELMLDDAPTRSGMWSNWK